MYDAGLESISRSVGSTGVKNSALRQTPAAAKIACFEIKTVDKQIVRIQAYNQLADFAYSQLNKNDKVLINGYIEANVVKVKCINVWK